MVEGMESSWSKNSSSRSMHLPRDTRGEALIPASRKWDDAFHHVRYRVEQGYRAQAALREADDEHVGEDGLAGRRGPTRLTTSSRRRPSATDVLPPRARLRSPWSLTLLSTAA